jgi:hypothetical protein
MLKQKTLKQLKDGDVFQRSARSNVQYQVIKKEKGMVTFTSLGSNLSFTRPSSTVVYV